MVMALDDLMRQHEIDPEDVPESTFADALELLLQAAVALARTRPEKRGGTPNGPQRRRAVGTR
jgi:hypothetical protein